MHFDHDLGFECCRDEAEKLEWRIGDSRVNSQLHGTKHSLVRQGSDGQESG